ncbi:MAG: cupin domain-containing protein [Candidatus Micrarchaeota archaeon]
MKTLVRRKKNLKEFVARDGALVYELFKSGEGFGDVTLASGFLKPKQKAIPHFHRKSDEIYYIASGKGKVMLNNSYEEIEKGDAIFVPRNTIHALVNENNEEMHILALMKPPYSDDDMIFTE